MKIKLKKKQLIMLSCGLAVILLIIIPIIFNLINKKSPYDTVIIQKGTIVQEVSVTGKVKSTQSVDLAFEKSGRVNWINTLVGERVYIGKSLIQIDNSELAAQLEQAKATVAVQQAKLDELKIGTRQEEIIIQEGNVKDSKQALVDKINDAYTKSDDAIRNKSDQIFNDPRTGNPQIKFAFDDFQLETAIETGRVSIEFLLNNWKNSLTNLSIQSNLEEYSTDASKNLSEIKLFLEKVALVINNKAVTTTSITQTNIDTWKTDISTARTNINTAITNLTTAKATLEEEENTLLLDRAGSTQEQILAQEAQVQNAKAQVQLINAQISKTVLNSPIDGIVTKQNAKLGEIVSANSIVISIMSDSIFEVETNIPEADISKVKEGDMAKITLDAYGPEIIFDARVIKIDPAETVIEGVPTYKTTLQFLKEDGRLKSGLTANIDITTAKLENGIFVPQRAIIGKNGDKTVKIIENKKIIEVKVKTGIKGTDGNIEITEGLKEGDIVITFIRQNGK